MVPTLDLVEFYILHRHLLQAHGTLRMLLVPEMSNFVRSRLKLEMIQLMTHYDE